MRGLTAQGYRCIGMDPFALPDDALAVAQRQGRLHRNVQGMCRGRLDFESIALAHLVNFRVQFAHELAQIDSKHPRA